MEKSARESTRDTPSTSRCTCTLHAIFEEFCTQRERKQGRIAHYTSSPEYDPKRETITRTTNVSRRVEIETTRGRYYVLLKTRDGWLIDNVRVEGRLSIS